MIPGLGKSTLLIGSDPACDIVIRGAGVAGRHAEIHNESGKLVFFNGVEGKTTAAGREMDPGESAPFDFHTPFLVGDVTLPFDHPAIVKSIMAGAASMLGVSRSPSSTSTGPSKGCNRALKSRPARSRRACPAPRNE